MENNSTHLVFDGKKIIISPDLRGIATFLQEIEQEVETLLNAGRRIESFKSHYREVMDLVAVMSDTLKKNSLDFSFKLSREPAEAVDDLIYQRPLRAEVIALFANLETLLCLNTAYEHSTSDRGKIINLVMDKKVSRSFYQKFCLNSENTWVNKYPERAKRITAEGLRLLRNSLAHFFSLSPSFSIAHPEFDEQSRKLEKKINNASSFLTPEDIYEIIKGAALLMLQRWSYDSAQSSQNNDQTFKQKIFHVKELVTTHGAIAMNGDQIKI